MPGPITKAGRYQIVSELGRGSMGVVYQGFDPVIGRTVAVKTMLVEGLTPAEFEDFKARFQREAQAAGVLAHPNIVTVYDFGEDEGILYLAMEFLEGKSLQDLVEQQTVLPVETIIPMYEQVCSALDHAHSHKIVHRDIKPANIMILDSGLVKVTDFGIAKMMSTGMTQAGQILGTPNYMSPEQVKGRQIDGRSDIFALGVVLYELVTGEKPFGGQNITTVIYKIINENPIPPRELDATIHPGLSYVIQKALAKNPDERYQTCKELAEDLKNYKQLGGMQAPSATVIVRVPPVASSRADAARAAPVAPTPSPVVQEYHPSRPLSVQVIPPTKPRGEGTSPLVWVFLTLLAVGVVGGGYYLLSHKPGTTETATQQAAPQPSTSQPAEGQPTQGASGSESGIATEVIGGTTTTDATAPAPAPTAGSGTSASSPANLAPAGPAHETPEAVKPAQPSTGAAKPAAPKIGRLLVTSNMEGARITIDDRSEPAWVTPYTIPDLPSGTHSVVVSKAGYGNFVQSVTIEGGRTSTLNAPLSVPVGEITIETKPSGIEVLIDGQSAGTSPVQKTVGLGAHRYSVRAPNGESYTYPFEIKADGQFIRKVVDLSASVPQATGIVEVRTIPPGASVMADGKAVGGTTPTSFRLPAGRHTLAISLPGFARVQKEVDIPADGSIPVNERLTPQ
ncbi:MAG: protein kinase [Terriglobia bacterium]